MDLERLKHQYKFLTSWPEYNLDGLRGIIVNDYGEKACSKIEGVNKYHMKKNCIKFYSILENLVHRVGLTSSKYGIWNEFLDRVRNAEEKFDYSSPVVESFNYIFGSLVEENILKNFNKYKKLPGNSNEVEDIMKLFYFSSNAGNIHDYMGNPDNEHYESSCKFINECLTIYKKYKDTKCSPSSANTFGGSTICLELNNFFDKYVNHVYPELRRVKHLKLDEENPTALLTCPSKVAHHGGNPFWSFLGNYSQLSLTGKGVVGSFIALGILIPLFILYKFTALGSSMNPKVRQTRRIWRNMDHRYASSTTLGDDDEESNDSTEYFPSRSYMEYFPPQENVHFHR
ncbi:VIR protein [Plasmodium vivax]|uniref:VIR protein n=1 Tax=Plasmodium vivax TaxID=5855 RepID=A0A1G4GR76_PLAVI|nr:VIR protein [Plasmodium vivax]